MSRVKPAKPIAPRVTLHMVREPRKNYQPQVVSSPVDVERHLEWLKSQSEEVFVVLHLNALNEITGYQEISRGTVSSSLVHPREVFKGALMANAHSIVCAHNHPTGRTTPSPEDIETTKQLYKAGKLLGVQLHDHVILGDDMLSLRETMPHLWSDR